MIVALVTGAKPTVETRVYQYGAQARARLAAPFAEAGVAYPPTEIAFVAIKDEARLEVWAGEPGALRFVRDYPVLAASGHAGPKLQEGDLQVPEGLYVIDWLNPNSDYHLSMHVSYPNDFDRARADEDGRTKLGGAIMIHGDEVSIGCLAMGDPAIEELFVLFADSGVHEARTVIAPTDFRVRPDAEVPDEPAWVATLYDDLRRELAAFRR